MYCQGSLEADYAFDPDDLNVLGDGATGVVWRATERTTRREVAIKQITDSPNTRNCLKLQRDAPFINGIVRVEKIYTDKPGVLALVMPVAQGMDLDRTAGITEQELAVIVRRVLYMLVQLHSCGIVHGDIKPENIVWCRATLTASLVDHDYWRLASVPVTNSIVSTEAYFPSDTGVTATTSVIAGCEIDIWALGLTVYALLEDAIPLGQIEFKRIINPATRDFIRRALAPKDTRATAAQLLTHPFVTRSRSSSA